MATRGAVYNNKATMSAVGRESQYFAGQKNININKRKDFEKTDPNKCLK